MIDNLRFALYALLAVIVFYIYQEWNKEHPAPVAQSAVITTPSAALPNTTTANNYIPDVTNNTKTASAVAEQVSTKTAATASPNVVHVKTDIFNVDIDTVGGNILSVALLKFPEQLHSATPYVLLNDTPDTRYIAQSGLLSSNGPDTVKGQAAFTSEKPDYTLSNDQNELQVKLHWQDAQGLKVTKIFTFHRGDYEIDMNYLIDNQTSKPWSGNLYLQLMRKADSSAKSSGLINLATYFGAAISSPDKLYQKITFKDMASNNLNQTITGGWAAMIQHYFVSAWVPEKNTTSQYFSRITNDGMYTIGMIGPKIEVNPGQSSATQSKFYAGPSIATQLEKVAPGLPLTIDYGWLWIISAAIFWMMQHIFNIVGNWGWSIVLVTLVIKLMFYHLSAKSYRSMSSMKMLQPKIAQLKERFGEDKQGFTKATIELYRKEKVNPMSGCLPILIQIPVFIGLYWVLIESVQLRQAPWILWIHDLSIKDPFYVLPVLMGLSMFLQQRLNPPPPDPMQAKIMMLMPVVFTAMFVNFPAGLMLYWFVNNSLSFLQQWYIMHSMKTVTPEIKKVKR
jgi:YidC/Oxa1 family membrane protein insertase